MNLTNFLKQIDNIAEQYTAAQLLAFIHEAGRVLPEADRADFLARLKSAGQSSERRPDGDGADFQKEYQRVRNHLNTIDSQEVSLEGILNENYDDWYDGDGGEFVYEDNGGISEMLKEAYDFVHVCMDREKYAEGYEIDRKSVV